MQKSENVKKWKFQKQIILELYSIIYYIMLYIIYIHIYTLYTYIYIHIYAETCVSAYARSVYNIN